MEPCELEFIGENETIGIIPNFTLDNPIHLISGSIGPFRAGLPVHGKYSTKCVFCVIFACIAFFGESNYFYYYWKITLLS